MRWLDSLVRRLRTLDMIDQRLRRLQDAIGRVEARQLRDRPGNDWKDKEFQVYSQWGEDGLIQYLVEQIGIPASTFVEFGVENYHEANTRFLASSRGWSGLVMDASEANIRQIRRDPLYWRCNLKAEAAFITRENINDLLRAQGIGGEIGLLSIDIDGNDYWIWEAITVVDPIMVIVEYNARFGPTRAVTVPYNAAFERKAAHSSMIYYGASLRALWMLGKQKNYALVGCNSAGNNAFFVRRDSLPPSVQERTPEETFSPAKFRESRDASGSLIYLDSKQEADILDQLPLVTVDKGTP